MSTIQRKAFRVFLPGLPEGGLRPGTTLILVAPPGGGKTTFCLQFLWEGLKQGERGALICFDAPVSDYLGYFRGFGHEAEPYVDRGSLHLIDFFDRKPESIGEVSSTIESIMEHLQPEPTRLAVDSLSAMGLYFQEDFLPPWVLHIRASLKEKNALACLVIDSEVHPKALVSASQTVSDGMLQMKIEEAPSGELRRFFRAYNLKGVAHSTKWVPYQITSEGIKYLVYKI
ncbi:MAG: RAD55 family ATPase [Candidatus Geothermarchaeales archaeon]